MQHHFDNVQDQYGNAVGGVSVLVSLTSSGARATVYSDNGINAKTNPLTTSATGGFDFYAANGDYTLTVTHADGTTSQAYATLFDVNDVNATAIGFSQLAASTGSSLIGFIQSGTGAVARTAQDKQRERVSVKDFGAKGDGVTDDTAAIQAAFNAAGVLMIQSGTYLVNPLTMSSNTTLIFDPRAVLKAKTGYGANDRLLTISGVSNVVIHGNGGAMQMLKSEYSTGEQRHCVNIYGATNVAIYDLTAKDSGGDGFYIGGDALLPSRNVLLSHCTGDNNRRQGLSIANVIGCRIDGGLYQNTIGTAPECGIDVESNLLDGYYLQNVVIDGVRTYNNNGGGVLITPQSKYAPVSITSVNCTSEYDGDRGGLSLSAAMAYITGTTDPSLIGKIDGFVFVDNMKIINPQGRGLGSINWTENAPDTHIGTVYVLNPCSNAAYDTNDIYRSAFTLRSEVPTSGQYGTCVGNLRIDNLIARDNRAVKKMKIPLYLNIADETNKPLKNLFVGNIDTTTAEYTSVALTPVLYNATKATNCNIKYLKPWYATSGSFSVTAAYSGAIFYPTVGSTYTLAPAANCIGTEVEFFVKTSLTLNVTPDAGDTIDIFSGGVAGNAATSSTAGSRLKLRAVDAGRWEVVNAVGTWA